MSEILPAFIVAVFYVLIHLYSNKLRFLHVIPRSRWLSIAGGASISYVFIILLPELAYFQEDIEEAQFLAPLRHHSYFFSLVGLSFFYSIERIVKGPKAKTEDPESLMSFWVYIAAFAVYNALIGYLLIQTKKENLDFFFFAAAMSFHFITNDYGLYTAHPEIYLKQGRWMVAFSVLIGFIMGLFYDVHQVGLAVLFSFIAGGMILNVLKEELPEERASNSSAFWLGVIGYSLLILFDS